MPWTGLRWVKNELVESNIALKTEAINANLEKRQKIHEYIDLWAPKAQAKKPALKTPEDKKAEAAKKRLQHEQQRSLNALRPTPNKEPLRANSHRPIVSHTLPPSTVTPVTPLARPLSSQVNSQLDPRRRPSSSSSTPGRNYNFLFVNFKRIIFF